jgi:hypothetical protein
VMIIETLNHFCSVDCLSHTQYSCCFFSNSELRFRQNKKQKTKRILVIWDNWNNVNWIELVSLYHGYVWNKK